ncbi:hypothetical protein GCM10027321_22940 [Massilia terrae]|uniref:Phage tail sheath subtilisin-like domain-containing protein n=1 Tax=Massilia terrae TaxID=1811224 RepID=A0ABT2CXA8_9BURK|nr:phage tail sheath C-terminal domain-containing protein [Massilia terrae]MCS0658601.1 phage tail sheath subtilisin-like domain-containing protein [Massilia terrae]
MATQLKTPGVYVVEENAFPNSVVEVATAVPAFIGYTEKAQSGQQNLTGVPTPISSLAEYELYFGGAPDTRITFNEDGTLGAPVGQFFLYLSLRLFFDNGGGPCYIVSAGDYSAAANAEQLTAPLLALEKFLDPTMVVIPDAMLLADGAAANSVAEAVLAHCGKMQSRIGIFDVFDGFKPRTNGPDDVISGDKGFWSLSSGFLNYGVAYYPWLNTSLLADGAIDYTRVSDESKPALATWLKRQASAAGLTGLEDLIGKISQPSMVPDTHRALAAALPAYRAAMNAIRQALNLLPPSGAMAGVYTRIDNNMGVYRAPANTGINSAVSPAVNIDNVQQGELNVPLNGMAINAIRVLPGRGMVVWGARTLDGNSDDWRYVNVRRTAIMLEQSIKTALQAYVFAPNDVHTWATVNSMIRNFLTVQWQQGALMGAKPEDAFSVAVGLGSTMSGNELLDGYMNVSVKVALVRPAEFIVMTFQQQMAVS